MIARARALLARYEELWRARIARLDELLTEKPTNSGGSDESNEGV
jgi:hypothetical protein